MPAAPSSVKDTNSFSSGQNALGGSRTLHHAEVNIQQSPLLNYWLVTISCKDRNKLFFDTVRMKHQRLRVMANHHVNCFPPLQVCTLADMNYDVYHGTIDSEGESASQMFYVRPR